MKKNEELKSRAQQLLSERGTEALEIAKKAIHAEVKCAEVRDALGFFANYWHDLARPTLISICSEAVGGKADLAVPIAASMTLICGATDIHDDIIDKSKRKLSRETIFGKFGKDIALLVGDALLFEGFLLLQKASEDISQEKMMQIREVIANMFFELGDAEALELKLRERLDVKPREYLAIIKMKAADIEACTRIGAILGNGSKKEIDALGKYGRMLGTILILRDELADAADYDEILNRVQNEPLPLPIIFALQNHNIRSAITPLLLKKKKDRRDIDKIFETVSRCGAVKIIDGMIEEMRSRAHQEIKHIRLKTNLKLLLNAAVSL